MLPIGSYVGRIRIEALLGAGGMGEVYRGWDEKLERTVALKSITSERRLSPQLRTRFLREARVLSKLDHPNICRIWDVMELVDGDWLVLELIDGPTLRERIEQGLSKQESVEIALEIARVLAMAHGRGIIHRDLKPENVMQTSSGDVKVLDFGLARAVEAEYADPALVEAAAVDLEKTLIIGGESTSPDDSKTSVGSLVGTLHYMSPEQARGLPLTPASDVYSLGVMLHEMLRGGASAYGEVGSVAQLLQKVRAADLVPLDAGGGEVQRLVSHMTSLQPADRPAAGELGDVLARIAGRPALRRRRVQWIVAVAALLAVVAGLVSIAERIREKSELLGAKASTRLIVLPFTNATGDKGMDWVRVGLVDHVVRGLSGVRGLDLVSADTIRKSLREVSAVKTPEARKKILDANGADALVSPSVSYHDGRYVIRYAVEDARRSEPQPEVTASTITEAANKMTDQIAKRVDPRHYVRHVTHGTRDAFAALAYDIGREVEVTRGSKFAEKYYEVALDRDSQFLDAKQAIADAYAKEGRLAEAQPMMDEVIRDARERGEYLILTRALVNAAFWMHSRGDAALADQYTREAVGLAKQQGNPELMVYALNSRGIVMRSLNRLDESDKLQLEALELARQRHIPYIQIAILNNLGATAMRRNDNAASRRWLDESLQLAEKIGYRDLIAVISGNLAQVYGNYGDWARAEELAKQAAAIAREVGDKESEAEADANLAIWTYARGDESRAISLLERAASEAAAFGALHMQALFLSNLAQAHARRGELDVASRQAAEALAIDQKLRIPELTPDIHAGAAYPAIREGRLDDAQRLLDQADAVRKTSRAAIFRARLLYEKQQYKEASALIEQAKKFGDLWLPQYEAMRLAFAESAKTGKPSMIAFEEH